MCVYLYLYLSQNEWIYFLYINHQFKKWVLIYPNDKNNYYYWYNNLDIENKVVKNIKELWYKYKDILTKTKCYNNIYYLHNKLIWQNQQFLLTKNLNSPQIHFFSMVENYI